MSKESIKNGKKEINIDLTTSTRSSYNIESFKLEEPNYYNPIPISSISSSHPSNYDEIKYLKLFEMDTYNTKSNGNIFRSCDSSEFDESMILPSGLMMKNQNELHPVWNIGHAQRLGWFSNSEVELKVVFLDTREFVMSATQKGSCGQSIKSDELKVFKQSKGTLGNEEYQVYEAGYRWVKFRFQASQQESDWVSRFNSAISVPGELIKKDSFLFLDSVHQ